MPCLALSCCLCVHTALTLVFVVRCMYVSVVTVSVCGLCLVMACLLGGGVGLLVFAVLVWFCVRAPVWPQHPHLGVFGGCGCWHCCVLACFVCLCLFVLGYVCSFSAYHVFSQDRPWAVLSLSCRNKCPLVIILLPLAIVLVRFVFVLSPCLHRCFRG